MLHIRCFTFSPIQENTYLLYNEKGEACIIDPGCYHSYEEDELAAFISSHKLQPKLLIHTHCHLDHVFGMRWVAQQYNLIPQIHHDEVSMLEMAPLSGDMWNLPFKKYEGKLELLREGQLIKLGDDELKVILAPGHSPGHLCFYNQAQHFLIGGDVLFQHSIGRTDLPGGNHRVLLESIRQQLFVLPDQTVVYPGHGPKTTIGAEKRHNPFLQES